MTAWCERSSTAGPLKPRCVNSIARLCAAAAAFRPFAAGRADSVTSLRETPAAESIHLDLGSCHTAPAAAAFATVKS